MAYHNGKQNGFIEHNGYNIDKVLHNGNCVFTQGFDRESSGTDSVVCEGTIGKDVLDWSIVGNTYQASQPSPSSPVSVLGVGDRTKNLFDGIYGKVPTISTGTLIPFDGVTTEYINTKANTDTFRLSFVKSNGANTFSVFFYSGDTLVTTKDLNTSQTITRYGVSDTVDRIRIRIDLAGNTISNIMLNEGSTPLPYEPYGVKIPVVSRGKNLFDKDAQDTEKGFVVNHELNSENGQPMAFNGTDVSEFIKVKPNTDYTLTPCDIYSAVYLCLYDEGKNFIQSVRYATKKYLQFKTTSNTRFMRFSIIHRVINTTMLYESHDIITEYEPYRPPITTTQYLPTPLMANEMLTPTSRDVKWMKRILTGNDTDLSKNTTSDEDNSLYYVRANDKELDDRTKNGYCSHVKSVNSVVSINGIESGFNCTTGSVGLYFNFGLAFMQNLGGNNIETMRAYLKSEYDKGTPVTIWYQLANPTTEPVETNPIGTLRNEEKTIKGTATVITTDTEVLPTQIEASYKSNKVDYVVVNFATADGNIFTTADGDTYTIKMRKSQYDTMMTNELLNLLEVM